MKHSSAPEKKAEAKTEKKADVKAEKKADVKAEKKADGFVVVHGSVQLGTLRGIGAAIGEQELPAAQAEKLIALGYIKRA